jgi:hypothetical protein
MLAGKLAQNRCLPATYTEAANEVSSYDWSAETNVI